MFLNKTSQKSSQNESFNRSRKGKHVKTSFREHAVSKHRHDRSRRGIEAQIPRTLTSPIITISVGPDARLFAAHEEILYQSPYFRTHCQGRFSDPLSRRMSIPEEIPEIFSFVLEYLYKGDYTPRLMENRKKGGRQQFERRAGEGCEIVVQTVDGLILKDTLVYCTALRYGLGDLKEIALKKQGLQTGIQCSTIISSARYTYANTPDTDAKLRAHYLALIIRSRDTFKRSGTMQMEMNSGRSPLFFDLFVALCNHLEDVSSAVTSPSSLRRF